MDNKVNLSKVAKDLGLSVSTVSRALSGTGRVSEDTRQYIQEYLEDKKLSPNTRKKKYTDVEKNVIAVTIPDEEEHFHMPYFLDILSSVYDYFSIRGYQVIIIKTSPGNLNELEQAIQVHAMDGVIISRQTDRNDEIEMLLKYEVPFVLIGNSGFTDAIQIEFNIDNSCTDLVDTLIKIGYHKIAFIGANKKHLVNRKRMSGIKKAFLKNYLVLDPKHVFWGGEVNYVAEMAVERILADNMECIICMDDNVCLNVLFVLQKMGKRIPEDIRIASLHSSKMLDMWNPPITCIRYDIHMLGRKAGKLLYNRLKKQKEPVQVKLGYETELKESTKR